MIEGQPNQLGFNRRDADYYRETEADTALPAKLTENQELLQALSIDDPKKAIELLNKLKIDFVPIVGHIPADNREKARMILFFPGDPEKWISVAPSGPGGLSHLFSVIAVKRSSEGPGYQAYFKDYSREYDKDGKVSFPPVTRAVFADSCLSCHKSGPLALPPPTDRQYLPMRRRFNQRMQDYGVVGAGGFSDTVALGPGLGPGLSSAQVIQLRSESRLQACETRQRSGDGASAWPTGNPIPEMGQFSVDRARVRAAMNCTQCHDGVTRGAVFPPFNQDVFDRVLEGRMPPASRLNPAERRTVMECLLEEYTRVDPKKPEGIYGYLTAPSCDLRAPGASEVTSVKSSLDPEHH
jgi:mono/diheme cytochrome c family protein